MWKAMLNPADIRPMKKKLVKLTLLRYSGSKNKYGMPNSFPKLPVIMAKRIIQHKSST
jgi:hypothetical protein